MAVFSNLSSALRIKLRNMLGPRWREAGEILNNTADGTTADPTFDTVTTTGGITVQSLGVDVTGESHFRSETFMDASLTIFGDGGTQLTFGRSTTSITETVACATGEYSTVLPTNLADAWSITDGTNDLDVFTTTTGALSRAFGTRLTTTDGVASGTARVIGGRAYSQTAAGSALTASASETVLGSHSIPANTIKAGTVVKIRYQGIVTADNAGTTLTVRLRFGTTTLTGTALISHAATDTSANFIFTGEFQLVGRAAPGAASAIVGQGTFSEPAAAGGALKTAFLGSTNFATNGALLVEVTGEWNAADANSCRLDNLTVEIV